MNINPVLAQRPRTPSDTRELELSLGRETGQSTPTIHTDHDYDIAQGLNDSPLKELSIGRTDTFGSMLSPTATTFSASGRLSAQSSMYSLNSLHSGSTDGGFELLEPGSATVTNPFNFTPVQYSAGNGSIGRSDAIGKRRGHKYRHSSIHASAMQSIIKPPPSLRTPLGLPASLPMPTRKEAWWSMNRNQTLRLSWCACHFFVAGYIQYVGAGSLAMTALSRLLLFDAAGATVCVVVDVMGNFEVWRRSSIKHPFGLERADVLAGFGMAVFIAFMGLDVISHGVQHSLENVGSHVAHSPHHHDRVAARSVDSASLLAIISTLVSALLLKNHSRIGKAMRFELIAGWGKVLGNPSHFLTLSCSVMLLLLPFLPRETYGWFDKILSFVIAVLMIAFGVRLATSLASMLLMSFSPPSGDSQAMRNVIQDIAQVDAAVSNVDEARFWQVHYGLCMANIKLRYRTTEGGYGVSDDMTRIRKKVTSLIRQRLGGVNWDVSVQLAIETD